MHINYLDKSNSSPLHLAVRGGNIEAIYFCIANGAKIDQQQVDYGDLCACSSGSELWWVGVRVHVQNTKKVPALGIILDNNDINKTK